MCSFLHSTRPASFETVERPTLTLHKNNLRDSCLVLWAHLCSLVFQNIVEQALARPKLELNLHNGSKFKGSV